MINDKNVGCGCEMPPVENVQKMNVCECCSKYFGAGAFEKFNELLNLKAGGRKVVFIVSEKVYSLYKSRFENVKYEAVVLTAIDVEKNTIIEMAKGLSDTIDYIVGFGGELEIQMAKLVATLNNLTLVCFVENFVSVDAFLEHSYFKNKGMCLYRKTKQIDYLFIDKDSIVRTLKRENVVDAVFNIISKLGFLFELYVNCCIKKDNGFNIVASEMTTIYSRLNRILDSAIDLSDENILELMDINLDFATILNRINYNCRDKEIYFASIYNYLDRSGKLSYNALKAVAVQIFAKLYYDFIIKLNNISNGFYDIDKRVKVFDKTFRFTTLQFDLGEIVDSKMIYMFKRFQKRFLSKIISLQNMINTLIYKTLDLYEDSGFNFFKSLDREMVIKSAYFTADVRQCNSFLKQMRNLGVLDFYSDK